MRLPDGRILTLDRAAAWALVRGGAPPGSPEWIALAEELARSPVRPEDDPRLTPAQLERLEDLRRRIPSLTVDGPRAATGGGWQMFLGGLPGAAFVLEYAGVPGEAVLRALERAEALAGKERPE